jgi:hypothetical protein
MTFKKQKDFLKTEKSIERLKKLSTQQIQHNLSVFTNIPLHIKRAYKTILKERGVK